jgi:alkylated DNA repair dioxygenase AlkB
MNVDTMNIDTMNIDTMNIDTMNIDTMNIDTMNIDTMNIDTTVNINKNIQNKKSDINELDKIKYLKDGLDIDFYPNILNMEEADILYRELETTVPWQRISPGKRSNVTYGDANLTYKIEWGPGRDGTHGKTTYRKAVPWDNLPILHSIKDRMESITGTIFNICVVQRYPSGKVGIKPHRDKEMTPGTTIVGLSVGATRSLRMTRNGRDGVTISLNPGSAYCLNPPTNDYWSHSILEDTSIIPRISLTFRNYTN